MSLNSSTTTEQSGLQAEGSEPRPLSLGGMLWYCVASIGCGVFFSFNNFILPLFMKQYTNDARLIGLMGSSHSLEGAIIQPIVGSLSDRTRTRWGRRRPFMMIFFPLSALFLLITPHAGSLPSSMRLAAILGCVFLFTVFFNIGLDPYRALMPDITPERQRGRVNSIWAFLGVVSQAGIALSPLPIPTKFTAVAIIMVVTTVLSCWRTQEPPVSDVLPHKKSHLAEMQEALRGLSLLHQARKGLLVFFISGVGIGAVLPYLTLFVQSITHCSDDVAQKMPFILMGTTAVAVLPCGFLADKVGAKTMLLASLAIIALASFLALGINTIPQVSAVLVLAGLGNAALSSSNYPLMTEVIPPQEVGLYFGLVATMESIAQPLTVFVTGTLINQGSYRVIFAVCGLCMIVSLFVLSAIDRRRAKEEVAERVRLLEIAEQAA